MGLISRRVVDEFLNRKMDSYNWMKKCKRAELEAYLEDLPFDVQFKTKPFIHQLVCVILGLELGNFLFLLDMGTGKTKLSLDCANILKLSGKIDKTLVLVPEPINIASWEDEISIHTDLRAVGLSGTRDERIEKLHSDGDIYIINYMGLQALVSTIQKRVKRGKTVSERVIVKKELNALAKMFDCIIYDELHKCKNKETLSYRICKQLTNRAKFAYGLTGTPFGRDPIDFWAEFYLVDKGETLGKTLGLYRSAYFKEKQGWFGGTTYEFDRTKRRNLSRRLKHRSIRYADWECNDLPKKVYQTVAVNFENSAHDYYQNIIKTIIDMGGGSPDQAENNFVKLRQIASGFAKVEVDGDVVTMDFPDNPKIAALKELILSVPPDRKMVIFYEFVKSGDLIEDLLKEIKIGYVRLDGTVKGKDKGRKALHKFNKDAKCRVFSANSKSGGVGLNLQVANYEFFYESPVSPIVRSQAEKRCHRTGQTRKTFIYSIIVKGSVEEKIEEFIEEGKDLFKELVESKTTSTMKLLRSLVSK